MGVLMRKSYGYSKVDKEDPEEISHRRAQFLIYKVMEEADYSRRPKSSSFLRIRLCRLKVKVGTRLMKLRKSTALVCISSARIGVYKQLIINQLKTWRRLFNNRGDHATLPRPLFA